MTEIVQALEHRAEQAEAPTVLELLDRQAPALAALGLDADRFRRVVLTEVRRTPRILECSPASFLGAVMLAGQLGLEPGPLGHVYFVPFKQDVQLIVGYKGYIDLAYRSGLLRSISAGTVREGDAFSFREGTRPYLDHTPSGPAGERAPVAYYAVASLKSGGAPFRVLWPEDVEKVWAKAPSSSRPDSPWTTHYDEMARKTAIRRLAPFLPVSPVFAQALAADGEIAPPLGDEDATA